ncbi:MAG: 4Fe-4S dicluster domain-containing protein [Anaerolineae bacterium]|jgi:heterodisulfide reductase subunit C
MAIAYESDLSLGLTVQDRSGVEISRCYFCQKCTSGCPVAFAMDYKPAQLLRLIQLGQKDEVLGSSAIWLCVGCETCGTRCPNEIRLAPMFDTLRHIALEAGYKPEPAVYALHRSFLDSIRMWGRVHELTMLMEYKTRSLLTDRKRFFRELISDLKMGGDLILKGKISFTPERVKRLTQVRGLYQGTGEHSSAEVEA